jgi:glutamate/tyrosine decarboxylase-like PLP-dependent enzyme
MPEVDSLRGVLMAAAEAAASFVENLERMPVAPTADFAALRTRLAKPLNNQSIASGTVIGELLKDTEEGIMGCSGGRFFGWAIGGTLPSAIAADWLVSVWDQNAALHSCGPAVALLEEVAGSWLKDLLGLPSSSSFAFTTGCQMAHFTCLAAARHALLAKSEWDVEHHGLQGAPPIRIFANDQCHGSIERAARFLGLGKVSIIEIPTGLDGRILPDALEETLRRQHPAVLKIVLMQAGDFHTGSFDDFRSLIPIADRYGAWVHVDGAFGLWAAASPKYGHLTAGIEAADSWAVDGHKWLNVPFDCGYAIVANAGTAYWRPARSRSHGRASYQSGTVAFPGSASGGD